MEQKLKPVIYTSSSFKRGAPQTTQQILLLKAMQVTQDPKKLREMIGVKSVAEVYRTLDKMAMRKEYHEALSNCGISFDYIVKGIKDIADAGEKDGDRLKAFQTLLKSLGLEKYEASDIPAGGTWEEELTKSINGKKEQDRLPSGNIIDDVDYEVFEPEVPDSVKKMRGEEAELVDGIYE